MSFLSSAGANRRCILLCTRLLVQCAIGWSTPQAGIDDFKNYRLADSTGDSSIVRYERELIAPICVDR